MAAMESGQRRDMPEREPAEAGVARWGQRNTAGVAIASSLTFDAVSHDYGSEPVVSDVTIRVEPGEVMCLLGPSGSGKTTLLRLAAGIDTPRSGRICIDDRVVAGDGVLVPPERRGVGLVFQDHALFPHLTILQNVLFGLNAFPSQIARGEALRILARVGLSAYVDMYPHQLSGGEQQRVALARALAPRPGILLLDEPFSGLDARLRDSVREETIGLLRDTRATTVIVTHDPEEALRVGDHIALMRGGALVQEGTTESLYMQPASLFAARFFSELNQFHGRVLNAMVETPLGSVPAPGRADGESVVVCVRLADILVEPARNGGGADRGSGRHGRIVSRRFVGIAELLDIFIEGYDEPVRSRIRARSLSPDITEVVVSIAGGAQMVFDPER